MTPPTDLNAFRGTVEELRAGWAGKRAEPMPEPAKPEVTIIVRGAVHVRVSVNGQITDIA